MVKKNNNKETKKEFRLPADVLRPVNNFLQGELKKLLSKKQQIEKNDPFANPDRINDNAAEDTDAAEQFGHAQSEAIKDHLNLRIIQVRKALARVKIGKYGICENCNEFIDTKRLMTFPETTLCVKCGKKGNK